MTNILSRINAATSKRLCRTDAKIQSAHSQITVKTICPEVYLPGLSNPNTVLNHVLTEIFGFKRINSVEITSHPGVNADPASCFLKKGEITTQAANPGSLCES